MVERAAPSRVQIEGVGTLVIHYQCGKGGEGGEKKRETEGVIRKCSYNGKMKKMSMNF